MRDSRVASPGLRPWARTLLYAALMAFAAWPAQGQTKKPGIGLPGIPRPDFHYSWCEQKRPPGRQATCTDRAPTGFDCRFCPANGWSGYYAEFYQRTTAAMRGAWEADFWGTRGTHDGRVVESSEPTSGVLAAEFSWVEVTYPRTHEIYRRFWYEGTEGGRRENPILITEATLRFNRDRIDCVKALGAWPAPGETGSYVGYDPIHPVDVCTNPFVPPGVRPQWPVWVRNALPPDHPVNTGAPPPPPPPPVPPPIPAPPECEPLEGSRFLRSCQNRTPPLEAAECRELAGRNPNSTLASLLTRVCPEEPEPPPPLPAPEPPPVETCTPGGWECTWPAGEACFGPGCPSTGRLEIVVTCRECPEVEP